MSHNAIMHVGTCLLHLLLLVPYYTCSLLHLFLTALVPYCTCFPRPRKLDTSYLNLLASPARETSVHALPRIDMSHDIHVAMRYDTIRYGTIRFSTTFSSCSWWISARRANWMPIFIGMRVYPNVFLWMPIYWHASVPQRVFVDAHLHWLDTCTACEKTACEN